MASLLRSFWNLGSKDIVYLKLNEIIDPVFKQIVTEAQEAKTEETTLQKVY